MLSNLPPRDADQVGQPGPGGPDHPMRRVTLDVARDRGAWTPETAGRVRATFDELASDWHLRSGPARLAALDDAFERGAVSGGVVCLELGSGTGFTTAWLAERFRVVMAADLSAEMLARAPAAAGFRVQADAARLPLRDGAVDAAVLVNMLLFPGEIDRVLARDGVLVWVNSAGELTPIHLPAEAVEEALPGRWDGVASSTGGATWAVLRRSGR